MDLCGDLFFGDLLFGDGDLNVNCGCSDGESDDGELAVFFGVDGDLVGLVRFEVGRRDSDSEASGRQVFEDEKAGVVDCLDTVRNAALTLKGDFGAGDEATVNVKDISADAGGGLWVR